MARPKFEMIANHYWQEMSYQGTADQFVADIDGDGNQEILLGGETTVIDDAGQGHWGGELRIINFQPPDQLVLRHQEAWTGNGSASVSAVYAADVDGDGKVEVITGGSTTFYGIRFGNPFQGNTRAHLRVFNWDGKSLKLKHELVWVPAMYPDAEITSLWAADIDGDGKMEIICGGFAHAIDIHGEHEEAWFDVFVLSALGWTRKGRIVWPVVRGQFSNMEKLTVADVDGDGKPELITLGHQRNSYDWAGEWVHTGRFSIVKAEAQLIVWEVLPGDVGLVFQKKAETFWVNTGDDVTWPTSLWIGDIYNERGALEIVTACGSYKGPVLDFEWLAADLRIWRMIGSNLSLINRGKFQFSNDPSYCWKTLPTSVQGADIDGDKRKELICTFDCALRETRTIGFIMAMNPRLDFLTAPDDELFLRSTTYGAAYDDGTPNGALADTFTTGLRTIDINADGRIEAIISCTYSTGHGNGEILLIGQ